MKWLRLFLLLMVCVGTIAATLPPESDATGEAALTHFRQRARVFALSTTNLRTALQNIDSSAASIAVARAALIACRLEYKRIEALMEYLFDYPVNLYNRAPVYEIEEPYMEYQSPVGLQYIESLLLSDDVPANKKELNDQAEVLAATANDIPATLYGLELTEAQVLESLRLEVIRIMTLGITGYDAPQLKTGIPESGAALAAFRSTIDPILVKYPNSSADSVRRYCDAAIGMLDGHPGFDDFDRLQFLTSAALPLQEALSQFIATTGSGLNSHPALNHSAANLFTPGAIDLRSFIQLPAGCDSVGLVNLGRSLFFEKKLSGNHQRSCATCHQPDKAFTDGVRRSIAIDGRSPLQRNAPSLFYAAYQRIQFHDGRVTDLGSQMKTVLQNPLEMHGNPDSAAAFLNGDERYRRLFALAFPATTSGTITIDDAAVALAAFEATLAPFTAPFDRYIRGDASAMTSAQQRGFNLFMGKAQCGTCHFAPLFNGLLPPYYEVTELEVLNVPSNGSLRHPKADTDSGRFSFFRIEFNNGAFKTSTVRNSARTAPFMHNGAFSTLTEVVEFYNRGGGNGIGLHNPQQTLSDQPLHLSKKEVADIVAFLHALNDEPQVSW